MRNENKELVIITGVSGAGKSTAIGFLEDVGYYCIDNMPPVLLNTFLEILENKGERNKIAVVIDIRSTENFESLIEVLNEKEKNARCVTPKECFRLQGFPDDYFEKAKKVNSNTQLYKQAGNNVTVNVVYEIAKKIDC